MSHRTFAAAVALSLTACLAPAGARAADTFAVNPVHSSVVFRVKHMNTSHAWGRFNDIAGTFSMDADPSKMTLDFTVISGSIDTNSDARDKHLKSPDFFSAVQFPKITFKSKTAAKSGDHYEVSGDLTFHGVTKPVSVRVDPVGTGKDMKGTAIAGIDATFTLKQTDFGITKMSGPNKPIGDDVTVFVSIEGMKK